MIEVTNQQNQDPPNYPGPAANNPKEMYSSQQPYTTSDGRSSLQDKVEQLLIFAYIFVAAVLLFRFVLSLFGAKSESIFVGFIYNLTTPFMYPFLNMFGRAPQVGQYRLEFEVIVALLVYALVFFGINRLINIVFK